MSKTIVGNHMANIFGDDLSNSVMLFLDNRQAWEIDYEKALKVLPDERDFLKGVHTYLDTSKRNLFWIDMNIEEGVSFGSLEDICRSLQSPTKCNFTCKVYITKNNVKQIIKNQQPLGFKSGKANVKTVKTYNEQTQVVCLTPAKRRLNQASDVQYPLENASVGRVWTIFKMSNSYAFETRITAYEFYQKLCFSLGQKSTPSFF